jgi:hypothetical protein
MIHQLNVPVSPIWMSSLQMAAGWYVVQGDGIIQKKSITIPWSSALLLQSSKSYLIFKCFITLLRIFLMCALNICFIFINTHKNWITAFFSLRVNSNILNFLFKINLIKKVYYNQHGMEFNNDPKGHSISIILLARVIFWIKMCPAKPITCFIFSVCLDLHWFRE